MVDACTALSSGDCPIEAGETIVYNIEMKIEPIFPSVSDKNYTKQARNLLGNSNIHIGINYSVLNETKQYK